MISKKAAYYMIGTLILLSVALAISQHTVYTQNKTIATYKEVVEIQKKTIKEQRDAMDYATKTRYVVEMKYFDFD